jgi:hypothetical protein
MLAVRVSVLTMICSRISLVTMTKNELVLLTPIWSWAERTKLKCEGK